MSFASAHIKRLLPYHSYKVYLKALAEIVRPSAHMPNLLPYRSYKLEDKYREVIIGTSQASIKALINEKFSPLDTPDSYKQRIQSNGSRSNIQPSNIASQTHVTIPTLLPQIQYQPQLSENKNRATKHLESIAMSRIVVVHCTIQNLRYLDNASRNPDVLENFIEDELYKRLEHVNYHLRKEPFGQTSEANGNKAFRKYCYEQDCSRYLDNASRNPDVLENFIEDELYKRLEHVNYHLRKEPFGQTSEANVRIIKKVYAAKKPTKVTYKCSNCEKIGHRKNNCPPLKGKKQDPEQSMNRLLGVLKKPKMVNYTYQSEPENSDQENESIVVLEDSDEEESEAEESTSDNESQSCFNEVFFESLKYMISELIPNCPREILIEFRTFLNNLFIKIKDQFDSYYGKKYTVKERNKVWEIVAKKHLTIFQPFIELLNRQSPNSSSYKDTNQNYYFIPYPNIPENIKLYSLNHTIKVYQGAQITRNWPNPFEVDFLKIEPNDVATILCRIGDLIIAHTILDTSADSSIFTDNIPEHLGIKIDKKNVHKLIGAVGNSQSIGTLYNVLITIGSGKDSITVHEDISVIPTKKDRNGNDISIMILGTKWQHCAGWDPIIITIPLSTHKEKNTYNVITSDNIFNTEKKTNDLCSDTDTIKKITGTNI
ncbi:hypothetical protein Glove_149g113 [Diversispora epigaea]|uniref:CCHC-type domain-containing protein n=1 Tax=Diversispora epigaea TaxID=1348612 RepID=A0A397ITQ3_9GLOM|nr:hypothetical protein Glove_149g113 [Diversispora epigaea]